MCFNFIISVSTDGLQFSSELPPTLHERFMRIKQMVKDAIAAHHTFMIYGRSRVIRECMLKRGWCEKFFRKNGIDILSSVNDIRFMRIQCHKIFIDDDQRVRSFSPLLEFTSDTLYKLCKLTFQQPSNI